MTPAFDPHLKKYASVYAKAEFICVKSCAGYRRIGDEQLIAYLPGNAGDEAVGTAILEALAAYRVLAENEIPDFFAIPHIEDRNKAWELELMERSGYKTIKDLYRGLMHVSVRLEAGEIVVRSTRKDSRNGWEGIDPVLSTKADLGCAAVGDLIQLALAECT